MSVLPALPQMDVAEPVGADETAGMRALWCAVLHQALENAVGRGRVASRNPAHLARQARAWIGSEDFHAVCALAGVDGGYILRKLREADTGPDCAAVEMVVPPLVGNPGGASLPIVLGGVRFASLRDADHALGYRVGALSRMRQNRDHAGLARAHADARAWMERQRRGVA